MSTKKELTLEEVLEQKLPEWKKEHGKIYQSTVDGEVYIWRKLKRKEYIQIVETKFEEGEVPLYAKQDLIAKTGILYPFDADKKLQQIGGLASTLSDEIVLNSGFNLTETKEI